MPCTCAAIASSSAGGVEPGRVDADVAVRGVGGEQHAGRRRSRRPARRTPRPARAGCGRSARPPAGRSGRRGGAQQRQRVADRPEHAVEQRRAEAVPPADEVAPGLARRSPSPSAVASTVRRRTAAGRSRSHDGRDRRAGVRPLHPAVEAELGAAPGWCAAPRRTPSPSRARSRARSCRCRPRHRRPAGARAPRRSSRRGPAAVAATRPLCPPPDHHCVDGHAASQPVGSPARTAGSRPPAPSLRTPRPRVPGRDAQPVAGRRDRACAPPRRRSMPEPVRPAAAVGTPPTSHRPAGDLRLTRPGLPRRPPAGRPSASGSRPARRAAGPRLARPRHAAERTARRRRAAPPCR